MMFILAILIVLIVSLFALLPSFQLALFGDDWLEIWRFFNALGPNSSGQWNYLTYYLTKYGSFDIAMGLLTKVFGYEPVYFHIASYILRIIATLSFYPLSLFFTKNRLASFFSVLFFSVTTIGLDTTNWVFNMPIYATIAFFNLFLFFYLKSRESGRLKLLVISQLFFFLAIVTGSIRLTGILPFIILSEIFWLIQAKKANLFKSSVFRIGIVLLTFLFIIQIGVKIGSSSGYAGSLTGDASEWRSMWDEGVKMREDFLHQGKIDFILYPLIYLGTFIVPTSSTLIITNSWEAVGVAITSYLIFSIVAFFIIVNIRKINFNSWLRVLYSSGAGWTFLCFIIYKNIEKNLSGNDFLNLIIGGYVLIITIVLIVKYITDQTISNAIFISLSWTILSFILIWLRSPQVLMPVTHRYFITSAVGIGILLSVIISLGHGIKQQRLLFLMFSVILALHMITTRNYLSELVTNNHGSSIVNKIWSQMPYISEIGRTPQPLVFYFTGENKSILHGAVGFGFPYHMALLYNIHDYLKMPVGMDEWSQVVSAVSDGKSFIPHGQPVKSIPITNVYAFRLDGKDNLIDTTTQVREKLVKSLAIK